MRIRSLAAFLLQQLSGGEPDVLKSNLRTAHQPAGALRVLVPLLLSFGSETSLALNVPNFVHWLIHQLPEVRPSVIPGLVVAARRHPNVLKSNSLVRPVETQLGDVLSRATSAVEQRVPKGGQPPPAGLFGFGSSRLEPVTEPDGTIAREFFTVLNNTHPYTEEQSLNVQAFSALYSWLSALHESNQAVVRAAATPASAADVPLASARAAPDTDEIPLRVPDDSRAADLESEAANSIDDAAASPAAGQDSTRRPPPTWKISGTFQEIIITYCLRAIEQSKLRPPSQAGPPASLSAAFRAEDAFADVVLVEAIRILDLLCLLDPFLVPRLFNDIKKVYNRAGPRTSTPVFLAVLQFFLNHSAVIVHDPEPVFRAFFSEHLGRQCTNALVVFDTLLFCNRNKEKLLRNTTVFSAYFPPFLKLFAWFPRAHYSDFAELLPALVSGATCSELLHALLDLPLLGAAMERAERDWRLAEAQQQLGEGGEVMPDGGKYRVLHNHLLRNESGVSINFWEVSTVVPLLHQFCREAPVTPRLAELAHRTPELVGRCLDVMITHGDEQHMRELLPVLFQRMDQLFPLEPFQSEVRRVLEAKVLAIFRKWPSFVVTLKDLLVEVIADSSSASREELILCVCWAIGNYTSTSWISLMPEQMSQLLNDYHEALELFAYERMSMVKVDRSMLEPLDPNASLTIKQLSAPDSTYYTRLMLIVISALAKLAARWQPLASRVMLCLAKILRHDAYFAPAVIERATECITILKYPSIASAILDPPPKHTGHIDDNSSLPFLLQTTAPYVAGERFHAFLNKR